MIKIAKMRPMAERPLEYYEGTASEEIVLGEALVLSSGKLTKCGATATPEFISMGSGTGVVIPVVSNGRRCIFCNIICIWCKFKCRR